MTELEYITKTLKGLEGSVNKVANKINKELSTQMTPQEYTKFKAFMSRYLTLVQEGKLAEAKELENKYRGE